MAQENYSSKINYDKYSLFENNNDKEIMSDFTRFCLELKANKIKNDYAKPKHNISKLYDV